MGLIFDIKTTADAKLLEGYDDAVRLFRDEVARAMEDIAAQEPSVAKPLRVAAAAVRARPLPSEADADETALKRLALSSLATEAAFSKLKDYADSEQAFRAAIGVAAKMREISSRTIGKPEFRALTNAVLSKVGEKRPETAKEISGLGLDALLAKFTPKPPSFPKAPKP